MKLNNPFARTLDGDLLRRYPPLREFFAGLGSSPLIEVPGPGNQTRIFAKCEWHNPTGSVKDRPVFGMLYKLLAETPAHQRAGLHLLEYTGGSLGLALARLCAALHFALTLVLSDGTAPELLAQLKNLGCEVVLVPKDAGFSGVMDHARALAARHPDWKFLFQHQNPANLWMHRETTAWEIAQQLPKNARNNRCAWVASIGTGGTLMGVYEALIESIPLLELFATSPAELPYATELPPNGLPKFLGSGGLGCGRKQHFVVPHEGKIMQHIHCPYEESLRAMRDFNTQTGLKIGSSAAANWRAACGIAETLGRGATVITVFPTASTEYEWRRVQALT